MDAQHYLVFGDLHGRILPAFRLATVWAKEHEVTLEGILQVGDLGYFPDLSRLDRATQRYAENDPTELGAIEIVHPNELADGVFADLDCPPTLWFTAGNHEDYVALMDASNNGSYQPDFAVDAYDRVRCIKDGRIVTIDDSFKIGALWGVDQHSPNHRTNLPERAYIKARSVDQLLFEPFQVLLTHDAPLDAKRTGYGSEMLANLIHLVQPAFAFFGHYHGEGSRIAHDYGRTAVFHLGGFELNGRDGHAEYGSVGLLTWDGEQSTFEFLDAAWLKTFTRHNWQWR